MNRNHPDTIRRRGIYSISPKVGSFFQEMWDHFSAPDPRSGREHIENNRHIKRRMLLTEDAMDVATSFCRAYEAAWSSGSADEVVSLYDEDAILVGYKVAKGKTSIHTVISSIFSQGFDRIEIRVMDAVQQGDFILLASEYTAFTGNEAKLMDAKSSQVLKYLGGRWVSVMHTAT
jgi:ketosteroid isomerase-like protein